MPAFHRTPSSERMTFQNFSEIHHFIGVTNTEENIHDKIVNPKKPNEKISMYIINVYIGLFGKYINVLVQGMEGYKVLVHSSAWGANMALVHSSVLEVDMVLVHSSALEANKVLVHSSSWVSKGWVLLVLVQSVL